MIALRPVKKMITQPTTLQVRLFSLFMFIAFAALAACNTSAKEEVGGETHWLRCESDSECDGGNACLCGLCSRECNANDDCNGVGPDPACAPGNKTEFASACDEPGVRMCVPTESVVGGDDAEADDNVGSNDVVSDNDVDDGDVNDGDVNDGDVNDGDVNDGDVNDGDVNELSTCSEPTNIAVNGACRTCEDARSGEEAAFKALGERNELFACEQRSDCVVVLASTPCAPHCSVGVAASAVDEFETAVATIGETWCPEPEFPKACGPTDLGCTTIALEPYCVEGRCEVDVPRALPDECPQDEIDVMDECRSCDEVRTAEANGYARLTERDELFACDADTDCVAVDAETGCAQRCPIGIAATGAEAFLDELTVISETWCPEPGYDELCGVPQDACPYSVPTCESGRCTLMVAEPSNGITGYPFDAAAMCFDRQDLPAGTTDCRDGDPVISYALDPTGACWLFGSSCVPDGFTGAGAHACVGLDLCPEPTIPDDCASRTVAQCESDEQCVVVGAQANQGDCFGGDLLDVGCMDVPGGCDLALTPAVAPDGTCWLFSDSCMPAGYSAPDIGQCPTGMCVE